MNVAALMVGEPRVGATTAARACMQGLRPGRVTAMASVTAWVGLLLALGLSIANVREAMLSKPAFWVDYRLQVAAAVILVVLQGLLIAVLLLQRRARLKAEAKTSEQHTELVHTSRLAVVGQLSASIAHEINQPLGAILSNADAAELMLATADPDLGEMGLILADIRKDGLRASEVVRQVRTLARKRPPEFTEIDLQDLCEDVLHLVVPVAQRRGVTILADLDPQAPPVRGDPVLLQQAVLNLLLNAIDALADVPMSQAVIELHATSPRPGEVEVAVRDHGNGVSEPHLGRLFDAFFTTKTHGLGLGLPIVRSIVESHGGQIQANNHPDGGAEFRFTIPVVAEADVANHPARESA